MKGTLDAHRRQLVRAAKPSSGSSSGGLLATGLPADVVQDTTRRLGIVGLLFASANLVGLAIEETLRSLGLMSDALRWERNGGEILGMVLGIALFLFARRAQPTPGGALALGLGFEIVGGLVVVFPEALTHVVAHTGAESVGVSWLAVWIAVYPMVLPASPLVTMVAGLITASMAPLSVWIATLGGLPAPPVVQLVHFYAPCYSIALLTLIPSSLLHRMRREVSEARALGSYRLEERLGGGGMGEVWRASHRLLARPAAIKLIGTRATAGATPAELEALRQRFEREAQATASLSSPHTVALHDFGVSADGQFFYVMELLDGLDFERLVKLHGPQDPERVAHLLEQACRSLDEAHARGLVHRDVKPSNLYVCRIGGRDDFVKVLDFGLVHDHGESRSADPRLTTVDTVIGTPATMAPETVLGGSADFRADLYALGCVGYWLLAGKEVFEGRSPVEVMAHHAHTLPAPPSRHVSHPIPEALEAVIASCLEKDPERRPPSAADLERRLAALSFERPWTPERSRQWWQERDTAKG